MLTQIKIMKTEGNNELTENLPMKKQQLQSGKPQCYWCGKSYDSPTKQIRTVCHACHQLLLGAGLTDKEIFLHKN